jgi:beta-lactamase regulating signal transducer with metallopeptidase domain
LRYGFLFAGVPGLLTMPALVGFGQAFAPDLASSEAEEIVKVPMEMLPVLFEEPDPVELEVANEPEPAAFPAWIVGGSLMVLWSSGIALGLARLVRDWRKQRRILLGKPWLADFWTDELKTTLAHKLGLRAFPDVRVSPATPMPMVLGFWRPLIVLPEQPPAAWDRAQWEAILLHEGAHIARHDPWAVLLQRVAITLFWWCPLAHRIGRRLNELREVICDDYALEGPCDQVRYAEVLVESAERLLMLKAAPAPLALVDSAQGGLEARIARLLEKERKPMTKLSMAGKILGAGFLVTACLMTAAATAYSQGAAAQKKVQIKIVVDGKEIDLGDAGLAELIAAAQRKAGEGAKAVPQPPARFEYKAIAISPDGKVLAGHDGVKVIVIDGGTGKVIAQPDLSKSVYGAIAVPQPVPAKADPRIEELVKAAEKIKPGSGEAVRKALQSGTPKAQTVTADYYRYIQRAVPMHGAKVEMHGDKKIIILTLQDGKVQQLSPQDLHKLLGEDLRFHIEMKHKAVDPKDKKKIEIELRSPVPAKPATTPVPPVRPTPPVPVVPPRTSASDLEALQRQLERINAELLELRKRLETQKK